MKSKSDHREQRLVMYWYIALIAVPLFVAMLLLNADPYERVQLNQVLDLRAKLSQQNAGAEVVEFLDAKGGHNLSEQEWQSIQPLNAEQLYFLLTSAQHSGELKQVLKQALKDDYVTQAEYQRYMELAVPVLMSKQVRVQFGL